jgi:hypothetical protein
MMFGLGMKPYALWWCSYAVEGLFVISGAAIGQRL